MRNLRIKKMGDEFWVMEAYSPGGGATSYSRLMTLTGVKSYIRRRVPSLDDFAVSSHLAELDRSGFVLIREI